MELSRTRCHVDAYFDPLKNNRRKKLIERLASQRGEPSPWREPAPLPPPLPPQQPSHTPADGSLVDQSLDESSPESEQLAADPATLPMSVRAVVGGRSSATTPRSEFDDTSFEALGIDGLGEDFTGLELGLEGLDNPYNSFIGIPASRQSSTYIEDHESGGDVGREGITSRAISQGRDPAMQGSAPGTASGELIGREEGGLGRDVDAPKKLDSNKSTGPKVPWPRVCSGISLRYATWDVNEIEVINKHGFLTAKEVVFVCNTSSRDFLRSENRCCFVSPSVLTQY